MLFLRENLIFLYLEMLCLGFKLVVRGIQCHCYVHLMNLTKRPVNHIEFQVLGFFLLSRGHTTPIPEDPKLVFLLTRYLLHSIHGFDYYILTQIQKNKKICSSVSIQKRDLKLFLCPPEWKKVEVFFSVFAHCCMQPCATIKWKYS